MEIISRFFHAPKQNFFLLGPRGTGKSTWLNQHFDSAYFIDLLSPDTFRAFSAKPERLIEVADAAHEKATIVIDEVQKVPEILDVVHLLIERKKQLRFVLTGSSSRKLKRSGVDLLAGRAIIRTMHPFMAAELGNLFTMEQALNMGMLPLVINSPDSEETLKSYVALYIREEVQMEGLVRNIGAFSRFVESITFSQGSVINVSDIARDCQVERKTVEGYVSVLEDLLLAFRVPVFKKRAKRNLSSHPKFYFFDCGVYRSLRPSGPLDSPNEIDGAALEGLVAQHILAWNGYGGHDCKLFFWRTKSGNEVDFVIYGKSTFCAIEVKNTRKVNSKMIRPLISFKQDYPEALVCLLYRGQERLMVNNVLCLPCEEFLRQLHPGKAVADFFA